MRSIVLAAVLALLGSAAHAQTPTLVDFATISMSAPGVPRTVTDTVCVTDGRDLTCDRGVYITSDSRVGIGTNTPAGKLALSSVSGADNAIVMNNSIANAYIGQLANQNWLYMVNNEPGSLVFGTSNTVRLLVDSIGRVGIGTETNGLWSQLEVSGTVRIANGGEACDTNRTGAVRYTGGDFWFCRNGSVWETLSSLAGGGGLGDRIVSGTSAVVMNSATGIVSITQLGAVASYVHPSLGFVGPGVSTTGPISGTSGYFSGSVGVGITNPAAHVHVSGSVLVQNGEVTQSGGAYGSFRSINGNYGVFSRNDGIEFYLLQTASGDPFGGWNEMRPFSFNLSTGNVTLANSNTTSVGVGTLTPTAKLDVSGTLRIGNGGETCDVSRTGAFRYTGGDFSFCRNGSAWETLTSLAGGGGLGDRIVSGTSAVVVNSATGIVSISQLGAVASYVHPSLGYVGPGVSTTGPISGTNGYFSGGVGIGTASPQYALDVNGSGRVVGQLQISGGTAGAWPILLYNSMYNGNGNGGFINTFSGYSGALQLRQDNGDLVYIARRTSGTAASEFAMDQILTVSNAGRVGINSSSPTAPLDVAGEAKLGSTSLSCDADRTGAIRYTGGDFSFCRNGSVWETLTSLSGGGGLGDRIVSGTSAVVVNSATGIVSITQFGSVASYVHPSLGYVGPGVSTTGRVSSTGSYLAATDNQCLTLADEGLMFRNATTRKLQVCVIRY